jgi:hypothetical protein
MAAACGGRGGGGEVDGDEEALHDGAVDLKSQGSSRSLHGSLGCCHDPELGVYASGSERELDLSAGPQSRARSAVGVGGQRVCERAERVSAGGAVVSERVSVGVGGRTIVWSGNSGGGFCKI